MSDPIPISSLLPSSSAGRSERRDAAENRARILATAEQLFAEHGVAAVNMADVAQAAGVGKGTLYRNFANKGELCLSLLDTQLKEFQDEQLERLREMTAQGMPYLEQLSHFLESLVAFTRRHMPLLCEMQQYSESLDESDIERPHFWQYMTVYGLLRLAMTSGELPAEADVAYLAEALLAPLAAPTFRFQLEILGFDTERIAAGLRTLLAGLGLLAETHPE